MMLYVCVASCWWVFVCLQGRLCVSVFLISFSSPRLRSKKKMWWSINAFSEEPSRLSIEFQIIIKKHLLINELCIFNLLSVVKSDLRCVINFLWKICDLKKKNMARLKSCTFSHLRTLVMPFFDTEDTDRAYRDTYRKWAEFIFNLLNPDFAFLPSKANSNKIRSTAPAATVSASDYQLYLRGFWCVQNEVRQFLQHLIESMGHVTLGEHLPRQIGQQAGSQLPVTGLAFQGQGHSHGGKLVLMMSQIELLQQRLEAPQEWTGVRICRTFLYAQTDY